MDKIPENTLLGWAWYLDIFFGIPGRVRFDPSGGSISVIFGPRNDGIIELTGEQIVKLLERTIEQRRTDATELSVELQEWRDALEG